MGVPYAIDGGNADTGWQDGPAHGSSPSGGTGPGQSRKPAHTEEIIFEYRANKPKYIAVAKEKLEPQQEKNRPPKEFKTIAADLADGRKQDLIFNEKMAAGTGKKIPAGSEVPGRPAPPSSATDEKALQEYTEKLNRYEENLKKQTMVLPRIYDTTGKAEREFRKFLAKNKQVLFYSDRDLDSAILADQNFITFAARTLNAPGIDFDPQKTRLHQALEKAQWDINRVSPIEDLQAMAFNRSHPNHSDGLTIMVDAVSYMYVFVESYVYDSKKNQYDISLLFQLFDAFGVNDIDIASFGYGVSATEMGIPHYVAEFFEVSNDAHMGFTAWWQLQHQFGYYPMVTTARMSKSFSVSTRK